jgi:hypothetical protein
MLIAVYAFIRSCTLSIVVTPTRLHGAGVKWGASVSLIALCLPITMIPHVSIPILATSPIKTIAAMKIILSMPGK